MRWGYQLVQSNSMQNVWQRMPASTVQRVAWQFWSDDGEGEISGHNGKNVFSRKCSTSQRNGNTRKEKTDFPRECWLGKKPRFWSRGPLCGIYNLQKNMSWTETDMSGKETIFRCNKDAGTNNKYAGSWPPEICREPISSVVDSWLYVSKCTFTIRDAEWTRLSAEYKLRVGAIHVNHFFFCFLISITCPPPHPLHPLLFPILLDEYWV